MKLFESYRAKKELRLAQIKLDLAQTEAIEQTISRIMPEARIAQEDPDAYKWTLTGQSGTNSSQEELAMVDYDHYEMLDSAFNFWLKNLFARSIVRNLSKFVLGKGPIVKSIDDNELAQEIWANFLIDSKWSLREKEIVRRVFRDGEIFLRWFVNKETGDVKVRILRANNIRNPTSEKKLNSGESVSFGIGTDPDDIETPITYYYCNLQGDLIEKIPAEEITHIKILSDNDMKRGISFLLVAMPMIKKYIDWLDDRIVLNKVRSAIALIRNVEGTSNTVESIRDQRASQYQDSDKHKQQAMERGTVITATKGIDYKMLSPNINASDVKDDGRAMLLAVAAGSGFPEMMFTADYSNANYGSTMVAQNPFVREIEDWQDFFTVYYQEFHKRVISAKVKYGDKKLPETTKLTSTVEWPPLILADILKNNQAREIQFRNKILSHTTWQRKEGLDPDIEEHNLIEEEGKDVYKIPFQPSQVPTNQFGQYGDEWEDEEIIEDKEMQS